MKSKVKCTQCGTEMKKKTKAKHSQGLAIMLLFGGIGLCFAFPPIGIVMIIVALGLGCSVKAMRICPNCGYGFDIK